MNKFLSASIVLATMLMVSDAFATARPGWSPKNTAKQNLQSTQHVAPGVPNTIITTYNSQNTATGGVTVDANGNVVTVTVTP